MDFVVEMYKDKNSIRFGSIQAVKRRQCDEDDDSHLSISSVLHSSQWLNDCRQGAWHHMHAHTHTLALTHTHSGTWISDVFLSYDPTKL